MNRLYRLSLLLALATTLSTLLAPTTLAQEFSAHELMSFFITSHGPGNGADLGGLEGADAHCQTLAEAVEIEGKEWKAYLSAHGSEGTDAINGRDRIGSGPWHNAVGVLIAENVDHLHSDEANLTKEASTNERGQPVNGRGDSPNMHDVLTGSNLDGTLFTGDGTDTACDNWTSQDENGSARVGHHDRTGGGENPTSWNSAHGSRGCSQANLEATGGSGLYYCFATGSARDDQ